MRTLYFTLGAAVLVAATLCTPVQAGPDRVLDAMSVAARADGGRTAVAVPATGTVEIAFSPHGGAEQLVIKAIDSARRSIRMLAYSFTSAPVTAALLRARKRGVDVALVADHRSNVENGNGRKSQAALGALVAAGVAVRTTDAWAIHHDKTLVIDERHVETGSFNYSASAEAKNSENVVVLWDAPHAAALYLMHWSRNWNAGRDFVPEHAR